MTSRGWQKVAAPIPAKAPNTRRLDNGIEPEASCFALSFPGVATRGSCFVSGIVRRTRMDDYLYNDIMCAVDEMR